MASAVPGMRFDGETRPDSHPDSWASFKRSYAYGWSLQRDLCNAAKEAMDARLAVTGSKSAALADKAKVLYLQSMQAYHKAVHATLSPKALQRIEQLLGNAAFAEAGPDALIKASDTLFNMPIASESYDERLRRLSLSESTSMAELVMDIHAVSTIGLSMSYPAPTPDDVSDFNAKLQANLDSSFSEAPFDSTAVVEEPTRFFPRIWLAIHDQVVDRAVAANVARASRWRSFLYSRLPNLDRPLLALLHVAREFDREQAHRAADFRRVSRARIADIARGRGGRGRGGGPGPGRGGRGRGRGSGNLWPQRQQQQRPQPWQQQQHQDAGAVHATEAYPAIANVTEAAGSVLDRLGPTAPKRAKASSPYVTPGLHTVRGSLSRAAIDAYERLPLNAAHQRVLLQKSTCLLHGTQAHHTHECVAVHELVQQGVLLCEKCRCLGVHATVDCDL